MKITIGVVPTLSNLHSENMSLLWRGIDRLDGLPAKTGLDNPRPCDAASGGFLALLLPDLLWTFRLPRVRSSMLRGHKVRPAPLGAGMDPMANG